MGRTVMAVDRVVEPLAVIGRSGYFVLYLLSTGFALQFTPAEQPPHTA
jgi:hypothetical protein